MWVGTHKRAGSDVAIRSGKKDEENSKFSDYVAEYGCHRLYLFNDSTKLSELLPDIE